MDENETVKSEYGVQCPKCGLSNSLVVTVTVEARYTASGLDCIDYDYQYDDSAETRCIDCEWAGTLADCKEPTDA